METAVRYLSGLWDFLVDPRTKDAFLVKHYYVAIFLILFYIYFVKSLGIRLMKNSQPFDCKYPMIVYNIIQVIWNAYMFIKLSYLIINSSTIHLHCAEVGEPDDYFDDEMTVMCVLYMNNKFFDFIDTLFMVLRKKNKQISTLHVYHHVAMAAGVMIGSMIAPGGFGCILGFLNTFVHTVMYSYYLLTVLYPEYKNSIWWKRHLTELQMAQFGLLGFLGTIQLLNPFCNYTRFIITLIIVQNTYIAYMFWEFYQENYLKPTKNRE